MHMRHFSAVGKYGKQSASKYCFQVKDLSVSVDDDSERYIKFMIIFNSAHSILYTCSLGDASAAAGQLLSESFCFVQSEDGKIVSVHYSPRDTREVVNVKKGIAAAFQGNFKNTDVEVEQDIQSKHYSHYRFVLTGALYSNVTLYFRTCSYETISPDHVIMHRTVDSENVIQYASSELSGKPISIQRAEDIEYNKGKLLRSVGTTVVNANGPVQYQGVNYFEAEDDVMAENNPDTYDATFSSGGLGATGKYSLTLQGCGQKSKTFRRSSQQLTMSANSLAHQFNKGLNWAEVGSGGVGRWGL